MSDHVWVQENLGAAITGGLNAEEQERFDRHVASCRPCHDALAQAHELELTMDRLFGNTRPDAAMEDRVLTRLRTARISRPGLWRFIGAAAAVILVGAVGAAMQTVVANGELAFPGMPRTAVTNNLKQIALNFASFHDASARLPFQGGAPDVATAKSEQANGKKRKEEDQLEAKLNEPLDKDLKKSLDDEVLDSKKADTHYYPPAAALVTQGSSSIHTSITGGIIGGKARTNERGPAFTDLMQSSSEKREVHPPALGLEGKEIDQKHQLHFFADINGGRIDDKEAKAAKDRTSPASSTPSVGLGSGGGSGGGGGPVAISGPVPGAPGQPGMGTGGIGMPGMMMGGMGMTAGVTNGTSSSTVNSNAAGAGGFGPMGRYTIDGAMPGQQVAAEKDRFASRDLHQLSTGKPADSTFGYYRMEITKADPGKAEQSMERPSASENKKVFDDINKPGEPKMVLAPTTTAPPPVAGPGQAGNIPMQPVAPSAPEVTSLAVQQPKVPDKALEPEPAPRKIIRTGNMDFIIDSFDAAVDGITKLINGVKGGFIATINSDKLPNGKMRGSVVVRMPPEHLDKFVMDLRRDLAKAGELVNQKIGSLDVTKQYYDLESRLKAARSMEERLIRIIKDGKGEIKDLILAEKELGVWRTKIEETEGEIRYYANQVGLSTLTISLTEKEIQAPFALVVKETVKMKLEADDVEKAFQAALAEVTKLKGRVTKSDLKQHAIGKLEAILIAEIAAPNASAFTEALKKLGVVRDHVAERTQQAEGGSGKAQDLKPRLNDVTFEVTLRNLTALVFTEKVSMRLEVEDVEKAHAAALVEIATVKGRVTKSEFKQLALGQLEAVVHAEVPPSSAPAFRDALKKLGILRHHDVQRSQHIEGDADRPQDLKPRYKDVVFEFALNNSANIQPRDAYVLQVASLDVPGSFRKLQEAVVKIKGQVRTGVLNENDKLNTNAQVHFDIPTEAKETIEKMLADLGQQLTRNNVQAPINEISTDRKLGYRVTLFNAIAILPKETFDVTLAVGDVPESFGKLKEAVAQAKGHVRVQQLNENDSVKTVAQLDFDVAGPERKAFDKLLGELGQVLFRTNTPAQPNQLFNEQKIGYRVALKNTADVTPREAFDLKVATLDVSGSYRKLKDAVGQAKGRILIHKSDEKDKINAWAQLSFIVPVAEQPAIDKLLTEIGQTVNRSNTQVPINEMATDRRVGYAISLVTAASLPPRENVVMRVEVRDVKARSVELSEMVRASKGTVADFKTRFKENGQMSVLLKFDVPMSAKDALLRQFADTGKVLDQDESRNPQVQDNDLATAHIDVLLTSQGPIVPSDEGLWPKLRTSLYYSFTIFSWSISLVVLGLSVLLPWALVVWVVIRLVQRMRGKPQPAPTT